MFDISLQIIFTKRGRLGGHYNIETVKNGKKNNDLQDLHQIFYNTGFRDLERRGNYLSFIYWPYQEKYIS